jgi:hypothetical protein
MDTYRPQNRFRTARRVLPLTGQFAGFLDVLGHIAEQSL